TLDRLVVHDHCARRRRVEPGQDVEHRGLAATGVPDDAGELAARYRQPEVLEHGGGAAARRRKPLGDPFDGDEFVGHGALIPGTSPAWWRGPGSGPAPCRSPRSPGWR